MSHSPKSHRQRKKEYMQQHGSPPKRKQPTLHHSGGAKSGKKPPSQPQVISFQDRLTQTFYAYKAHELKKHVLRAAHRLADQLIDQGLWLSCNGLAINQKVYKKELKHRISDRVTVLLEERESLSEDVRAYSDLHGLIEKWAAALNNLADEEGSAYIKIILDHIFQNGLFTVVRSTMSSGKHRLSAIAIEAESASAQFASHPRHEDVLVFLDLMVQGIPELKKGAVLPLLQTCLGEVDRVLGESKGPSCHLDLMTLHELTVLGQEGYVKGLLGALLDLQKHCSYTRIARSLQHIAKTGHLVSAQHGAIGPHLFAILFQVFRGAGHLEEINLKGSRWLPAEAIVDRIRRHPEIESLDLSYCRQLTNQHMDQISHLLSNLRELNLRGLSRIEGRVIEDLVAANFSLERLDLSECHQMRLEDLSRVLQILEEREGDYSLNFSNLELVDGGEAEELVLSFLGPNLQSLRT